jgi:predicted permease
LTHLVQVFSHNIIPIILVAGTGFALQRAFKMDARPLSITVFYILTPALVFNLLVKSTIPSDGAIRLAWVASLVILSLVILSWLAGRLLGLNPKSSAALILGSSFMNAGNYGLSLNQIALGSIGLAWASIYFIVNSIWTNSLGVVVAQAGRKSVLRALLGLARVPSVYAALLAFGVRWLRFDLSATLMEPIEMLSAAAVPLMLLVLGMQIAKARMPERWDMLAVISAFQLLAAPLIALILARLVHLPSPGTEVAVIESAMPTAVLSMIIALEFDTEPSLVTSAVVVTTLLSPLTITPILVLLGVG